jgi:Fe-S-cluster containining protein
MRKKRIIVKELAEPSEIPAGRFSAWLHLTRNAQQLKNVGANVPCGECNACCRSSMFIHIKPEETESLKRIPKQLLFPVPGLPRGHLLMGYDENGCCPMLVNNKCSIYQYRPETCRDYDCRIFSATGIPLDDRAQASIAAQVKAWRFEYPNELDHHEQAAVRATAVFLQKNSALFPPNTLPLNPVQLALMAVKVYTVFNELMQLSGGDRPPDTDIVKAVMMAMDKFDGIQPKKNGN